MIHAAIIDNDTLRALGLKYLIDKYFDICTTVVAHTSALDINGISPTIFFTTPKCYIEFHDFFVVRRSRTIILSEISSGDLPTINTEQDESSIIYDLNSIFSKQDIGSTYSHKTLTQREIDVLRFVAMGYINKEIADRLSISFNTVLTHRKNITAKLGIRSTSGLGLYAMMHGYISENDLHR